MGRTKTAAVSALGLQPGGAALTVLTLDLGDVGDLLDVEHGGHARHQVLSKGRVARQDVCVASLLDVLDQQRCPVLGEALQCPLVSAPHLVSSVHGPDLVVCRIVDVDDLLDALCLAGLLCESLAPAASDKCGDGAAELSSGGDGGERGNVELALLGLEDGECRRQPRPGRGRLRLCVTKLCARRAQHRSAGGGEHNGRARWYAM
jgi:hypothetical protein